MGSNNIFAASLSGLNAAMYELNTTQNNIANANTPGYTREQVNLSPVTAGAGTVGQGVNVVGVQRMYDQFLTTQLLQQQNQASYQNTYLSSMTQINNLLSSSSSGVSTTMQNFFSAANSMANNPSSIPARQTVLGNAQSVVDSFQSASQTLSSISSGVAQQISGSVQQINTYATQIAALNSNIAASVAANNGQQPNALLDQRDQLISKLNQQVGVTTQQQPDGTVSVFVGSGQPLVIGNQAMSLQMTQDPTTPGQMNVSYLDNGKIIPIQQNSLQGGNLGAYLSFQNNELQSAKNQLGLVALGFATNLNQQNQMGLDLNGALGAPLLNAAPPAVSANENNTGTASVTATNTDVSAMTGSNYQLKYDGTNYTLTRLSDNTVTNLGTSAPLSQIVDGVNVSVSTGMHAGDSFLIQPTVNAASAISLLTTDPTKLAAAAPILASAASTNTGTGTITPGTVNTPLPLNANLQATVTITFTSSTTYTVSGAVPAVTGNQPYTSGQNISYNGWTTQISGTPATGDKFTVSSNVGAAGDNRNALLMANLQTQNIMGNSTTTLQGQYAQLVSSVGSRTNSLTVTSTAQNTMVTQALAAQQSVSGVNLDEEAANLLQYQRAYQASAKAMQIANTMFDALITLR